jgi:hypothetical protein
VLVPCMVQYDQLPRGTYGAAGELPGMVVRLPRLQVGSNPAAQQHNGAGLSTPVP